MRSLQPIQPVGVLFVCLGNICRSPLAKGVFDHHAKSRGVLQHLYADSCGTGHWHVGHPADPRSISTAAAHSITLVHEARQFDARDDLARFQYILAMDRSNLRDIIAAAEAVALDASHARLLMSHDPPREDNTALDVPDPYYGGNDGFEHVYKMLDSACWALLSRIVSDHNLAPSPG